VVEKLKGEGSGKGGGSGDHSTGGGNTGEGVVDVKWVDSDRARPGRAVRSLISSITIASHGHVLVPESVDVSKVAGGEVSNGLAGSVSGAGVGAGSTLAGTSIISVEALAHASLAVADSLVGALHVIMSGIGKGGDSGGSGSTSISHQRVGLLGTVRVDCGSRDLVATKNVEGGRHVEISLGGVDVGKVERASTWRGEGKRSNRVRGGFTGIEGS